LSGARTLEQHSVRIIKGKPYRFEYTKTYEKKYQIICCATHKHEGYLIKEFDTMPETLAWINNYEGTI